MGSFTDSHKAAPYGQSHHTWEPLCFDTSFSSSSGFQSLGTQMGFSTDSLTF